MNDLQKKMTVNYLPNSTMDYSTLTLGYLSEVYL